MKRSVAYGCLVVLLLCIGTRLLILLDPSMVLDGDESVLGIMSKNIYNGKDFPLFFYGQQYGFTFFETSFIVIFYFLFGISAYAVKGAMLSLWAIGVIFFYLTLCHINKRHKWLPLIITAILICSPSWFAWSMKARGGYLTAFTLSWIIMYLLFHSRFNAKNATYLVIGVLLSFTYQSHAVFLLLPITFILYNYLTTRNNRHLLSLLLVFIALNVAFYIYKQQLPAFYGQVFSNPFKRPVRALTQLPQFLYSVSHGNHDLTTIGTPGLFQRLFGYLFCLVTSLLVFKGVFLFFSEKYYLLRYKKANLLFPCSTLSIALLLAGTFLSYQVQPRYILAIVATILFSLSIYLNDRPLRRLHYTALLLLFITGTGAIFTFREVDTTNSNAASMKKVLRYLEENDVQYIFVENDMMGWQIMFYSDERIVCNTFRSPGYAEQVNKAYSSGEKTAIVGFKPGSYYYDHGVKFENSFVYINPAGK